MGIGDKIIIGAVALVGTYIAGASSERRKNNRVENKMNEERKERIKETIRRVKQAN